MFNTRLILVFCFCMTIWSFSSTAQGADWKIFYQGVGGEDLSGSESINYYYDKDSIVKPSKSLVQVWFKTTLGKDDGSEDLTGKDGSDEVEQHRRHIEINCKSKSYRMIEEAKLDVPEAEESSSKSLASKVSHRLYLDSALGSLWSNLCE